jgi:hypothetical protein
MYTYRSIRVGRKVTSRYVGSGGLALGIAALDAEAWEQAQADREERRRLRELDRAADALVADVLAQARVILEAAGYHRSSGHWRRKRRGHREPTGEG